MARFTELQKLIGKLLVDSPSSPKELAEEIGISQAELEKAAKAMEDMKMLTRNGKGELVISEKVAEGVLKRRKVAEIDKHPIKLKIIIEAQAVDDELLERQLKNIEESIKKEEIFELYDSQLAKTVKSGEHYASFLDITLSVKDFQSLAKLLFSYGPSSIEVMKPSRLELTAQDLQEGLVDIADMVHAYNDYIATKMNREELEDFYKKIYR